MIDLRWSALALLLSTPAFAAWGVVFVPALAGSARPSEVAMLLAYGIGSAPVQVLAARRTAATFGRSAYPTRLTAALVPFAGGAYTTAAVAAGDRLNQPAFTIAAPASGLIILALAAAVVARTPLPRTDHVSVPALTVGSTPRPQERSTDDRSHAEQDAR